jgi:alanyl-tRNA synthetase
MLNKLYYTQPYQFEFEAEVISSFSKDGKFYTVLNQTAFFPGGGGQPPDTGWLDDIPVTELQELNEEIVHLTQKPLLREWITGKINSENRLEYMQQHTGQHILSQALLRIGNYPTVSVHFGEKYTAIEIKCTQISREKLLQAEELSNQLINKNFPIETYWVSREEIKNYKIRKPPPAVEKIRIVEIKDFDFSSCGGIHLSRTGEVGMIKIVGQEKLRGNIRIHAKIGKRAFSDYQSKIDIIQSLQNILTCGVEDIPVRVTELQKQIKENSKLISSLQHQILAADVKNGLSSASDEGGYKFVYRVFENVDRKNLRILAEQLTMNHGLVVAFFNINQNSLNWLVSHSLGYQIHLPEIISPLLDLIDGKGGGTSFVMQGGGKNIAGIYDFINRLKEKIKQEL